MTANQLDARIERLQSRARVIVLFSTPECQSCIPVKALLEDMLARNKIGALIVVNAAESPDCVSEWDIRSIPTVLVYQYGQLSEFIVGLSASTPGVLAKCIMR